MPWKASDPPAAPAELPPGVESFQEYADNRGREIKVDEENGILYDVKIAGLRSTNRGERAADYPQPVYAKSTHLYENATSFVGHSKPGQTPQFPDEIGVHKNVRVKEDGQYSDFHFNPKHPMASQLIWNAKHHPRGVAFSHDVDARCVTSVNGRKIVQEILAVRSVDLVAKGGTTTGLYEEEEARIADDPELKGLAEASLAAMDNARSILFTERMPVEEKRVRLREALEDWHVALREGEIGEALAADRPRHEIRRMRDAASGLLDQAMWDGGKYPTHDDTRKRHIAVLTDWIKELKSLDCGETMKEEATMAVDYKEVTIEKLREERADLVAILTGTDEHTKLTSDVTRLTEEATAKDAEIVRLTEEKTALAAKEAGAAKKLAIQEELKAAKFPIDNTTAFSERFQEQLFAAPDAGVRKALTEDRMALLATSAKRAGSVAPMAPIGGGAKQPNALRERFKL